MIVRTSNEICAELNLTSSKTEITLTADAKARVAGLLGRLGDIGLGGQIDLTKTTRVAGLLDEHVFSAAKTLSECRLEVLKTLKSELLPPPSKVSPVVGVFCQLAKPNDDEMFVAEWDDSDRSYVKLDGTFRIPGTHPGRPWETFKLAEHSTDIVSWCKYRDAQEQSCTSINRKTSRVEVKFRNEPSLWGSCRKSSDSSPGKF